VAARPGRRFTARETRAWEGLLRAHAQLTRALDSSLQDEQRLSITEFEVLIKACAAGPGGLRMTEVAEQVQLTPSGLTRLVDRLEGRGLLRRRREDDGDARAARVCFTEKGREVVASAAQAHRARIRSLFLAHLDDAELDTLGEIWDKVAPGGVVGQP